VVVFSIWFSRVHGVLLISRLVLLQVGSLCTSTPRRGLAGPSAPSLGRRSREWVTQNLLCVNLRFSLVLIEFSTCIHRLNSAIGPAWYSLELLAMLCYRCWCARSGFPVGIWMVLDDFSFAGRGKSMKNKHSWHCIVLSTSLG
jgi:hypothetical protein